MTLSYTVNELSRDVSCEGFHCDYSRKFEIRVSGDGCNAATEDAIANAVGIGYGYPHPANILAFAYRFKITQDMQNPDHWVETVEYKTKFTQNEQKEREVPDPLDRPAVVKFSWESQRMPVRSDRDGKAITNSAKQIPEQLPEVDGFLTTFNIQKNVYPVPDWVWTYRNRYGVINSDEFYITLESGQTIPVLIGGAKLHSVYCSELKIEGAYQYYEVSFSLTLRDPPISDTEQEGWVFDMVDMGTKCLKDNGGAIELVDCVDANGATANTPMLLDGEGYQKPVTGTPTDPEILYKDIYPKQPFSILPACG